MSSRCMLRVTPKIEVLFWDLRRRHLNTALHPASLTHESTSTLCTSS